MRRKELLQPLVTNKAGLQFNGHDTGDGELILKHAGKLGFEGIVSKTIDAALCAWKPRPMAQSQSAQPAGVCCAARSSPKFLAPVRSDAVRFRGFGKALTESA